MSKKSEALKLLNEYYKYCKMEDKIEKEFEKTINSTIVPKELRELRRKYNAQIDTLEAVKESIYKKYYKIMTKEFGAIPYSVLKKYPYGFMDKGLVNDMFNKVG